MLEREDPLWLKIRTLFIVMIKVQLKLDRSINCFYFYSFCWIKKMDWWVKDRFLLAFTALRCGDCLLSPKSDTHAKCDMDSCRTSHRIMQYTILRVLYSNMFTVYSNIVVPHLFLKYRCKICTGWVATKFVFLHRVDRIKNFLAQDKARCNMWSSEWCHVNTLAVPVELRSCGGGGVVPLSVA